jgi:transposase-like protein
MHDDSLKKRALELRIEGVSVKKIAEQLGVSKATLFRWIKEASDTEIILETVTKKVSKSEMNFEEVSKNEMNFEEVSKGEISSASAWYAQSFHRCAEIADTHRRLQAILSERLQELLAEPGELDVRRISVLSAAIVRHAEMEWRANGFDFLFYKTRRNLILDKIDNSF